MPAEGNQVLAGWEYHEFMCMVLWWSDMILSPSAFKIYKLISQESLSVLALTELSDGNVKTSR